ncbi:MAG: 50S ribosomal protein L4 [Candidatus Pacearchaeota archaeon]|nr:50S ribosomal protein L4 [Candidatus Pacearchaeota archaeon]
MKTSVYNMAGEKTGEVELPKQLFEVAMNQDLVHQVATSQMANRRIVRAKTKDRSEVSGGGKKPWRQKGTGRARHGSNRSPIWKGGGVTFGPTGRENFSKKINAKMRRKALAMVLTAKAKEDHVILTDDVKLEAPKTKFMAGFLAKLPSAMGSGLLVLPGMEQDLIRSSRNLRKVQPVQARELNCLDLLSVQYVIMPKASVEVLEKTFVK